MSGPFVYRPSSPIPFTTQYQSPYFIHTPRSSTPFIPDSALYPSSPYSRPGSVHASPNRTGVSLPRSSSPNRYAFPSMGYERPFESPWKRERRPSWHGVYEGQWLNPGSAYSGYQRRHSFGAINHAIPPLSYSIPLSSDHTSFRINPWIDAENPRSDFTFDMARPQFRPFRLTGPERFDILPPEELMQPATHPPITRMRIICDALPQYPMDLALDPYQTGYRPPPITLSDVLVSIHKTMHTQITHSDWGKLSQRRMVNISQAYTRRCRASASMYEQEKSKGIKRVDFLMGKTRMVGLVRVGRSDGFEVMKLVIT